MQLFKSLAKFIDDYLAHLLVILLVVIFFALN